MTHYHLSHGGVQAPRPRLSGELTWDPARHPKLSLASCDAPLIAAPGRGYHGLCEKFARAFGWFPGRAS